MDNDKILLQINSIELQLLLSPFLAASDVSAAMELAALARQLAAEPKEASPSAAEAGATTEH
jgi:hypothetical protein